MEIVSVAGISNCSENGNMNPSGRAQAFFKIMCVVVYGLEEIVFNLWTYSSTNLTSHASPDQILMQW